MEIENIHFQGLGRDLLYYILMKLDMGDLLHMRCLNSFFFKLLQNSSFWKIIFLRDFPVSQEQLKSVEKDQWRLIYCFYWRIQMTKRDPFMISSDLLTVTKASSPTWATSISRDGFGVGRYYWEVHINKLDGMNRSVIIGVTNKPDSPCTGLYQTPHAWGYYSFTGECYNHYKAVRYSSSFGTGDVIGVYLEVEENNKAHLGFFKNNVFAGFVPAVLTGEKFFPFVDMYREGNSITIVPFSSNTSKVLSSVFFRKKTRESVFQALKSSLTELTVID